ncbi:protein of unknown function [Candidatus Hydrogenisulfobacillus filiaventi]|uniref:Uncharacterized protein n=1 Tax=Candidatus Hydrogenisulfobacillus filiaventi TaxID=2707344 RepID=A0A6F8ZI78_9FIRM|nr:protein of unknown function [Candidatus Hydrogenisulfobacillus filiaventi]
MAHAGAGLLETFGLPARRQAVERGPSRSLHPANDGAPRPEASDGLPLARKALCVWEGCGVGSVVRFPSGVVELWWDERTRRGWVKRQGGSVWRRVPDDVSSMEDALGWCVATMRATAIDVLRRDGPPEEA